MDLFGLAGKSVLITGAGGGIGQALVAAFADLGAMVFGADRDPALLEPLSLAGRLVFELGDAASARAAIETHIERHGAPDILVSNAGFTRAETLDDLDVSVWQSELAINLTGSYAVANPLCDAMARRGGGAIVFVSSVNGLMHFGNPAYAAAKAGLIAYARAIAVERGENGVRANVVCPGSVRTPAWDHRFEKNPDLMHKVLPHYPLGRMVTREEVARAVLFLASDLASGITGAVLPVDAGLTAGNMGFVNDVLRGARS